MIVNNINLGPKKIYTNTYFTFDIVNNGTTDLFIYDATVSSDDVFLNYIKFPVTVPVSNFQTVNGYLKIIDSNDSTNINYIDFFTYYINSSGDRVEETYRYYLDYYGIVDLAYTNIWTINNIRNINNMLIIYMDVFDLTSSDLPRMILSTIDNEVLNILPRTYRISKDKIIYLYYDNKIINRIVNSEIKFIILSEMEHNNIISLAQRTI